MKVAIVTGGSGGIGRCTALALARAGCRVFEFSRHEKPAEELEHITADVTDEAAVKAAVDEVMARAGRIDILVCNAGFGISGAAELTSSADAHAQLELNLFGMDNSVKAVLPHMRAAGGGRIVCMSSIAVSYTHLTWASCPPSPSSSGGATRRRRIRAACASPRSIRAAGRRRIFTPAATETPG